MPAARWTPAVLAVVLLFVSALESRAGSGAVVVLPSGNARAAHGLRLSVDWRWPGGFGYRPVRVQVDAMPLGSKAASDRVLRVELTPMTDNRYYRTTVTQFVELAQGESSAEATVLVPVESNWDELRLDVYEDDQPLTQFSGVDLVWNSPGLKVAPAEVVIGSLVVSRDAPRLADRQSPMRQLRRSHQLPLRVAASDALSGGRYVEGHNDEQILDYYDSTVEIDVLHPADLPEDWLGLTEIDMLFVTLEDLRAIKQEQDPQFSALQRWLATGTTLWIDDDGWRGACLGEVERIVGFAATPRRAAQASAAKPVSGNRNGVAELDRDAWVFPAQAGCAARRYGLGQVFVGTPFQRQLNQRFALTSLAPLVEPSHFCWDVRHGVAPRQADPYLANWRIPGAGEPPVIVFGVLITLFVVGIGPVNLWLVRRLQRTYMILVTIPIAAVTVTVLLLGYAAVRDGFGVQARVRSFTFIDQPAGFSVSVSRQTYFASILPAEGLVFPADAVVYPLESVDDRRWSNLRRIDWRGDQQRMAQGYLPSRDSAQLVVFASRRQATSHLDVETGEAGDLQATNHLGTYVRQIVVVDAEGRAHWAEGVVDGGVANLQSQSYSTIMRELGSTIDANDRDEIEAEYTRWGLRSNDNRRARLPPWTDPSLMYFNSLLEKSIADCRTPKLTPNTYLAIVASSPETPLGTTVSENGSFHVIAGRW
ncbi:MAG: hypothetical protein RIC55_18370 [Pirellulaceae bacterium]